MMGFGRAFFGGQLASGAEAFFAGLVWLLGSLNGKKAAKAKKPKAKEK